MKTKIIKYLPEEPIFRWMLLLIVVTSIVSAYTTFRSYKESKEIEKFQKIQMEEQLRITNEETNSIMSSEVVVPDPVLSVHQDDCEYDSLGEYKVVDVFENTLITIPKISYKSYTNVFKVSGKVNDGFICIISDVESQYKGKNAYYFTTFIWFGNEANSGHINTAWDLSKSILYDNSTDKTLYGLNGKFFGSETPFKQYLPLSSIKVADRVNGGYKYIYPLQQLQRQGEIRIGGFTNDSPHDRVGKILKFRIFYRGGNIEPVGESQK